ncbi:TonB-dependent receptor plug domain-containing protein, partial [Sutterella massiliensis]
MFTILSLNEAANLAVLSEAFQGEYRTGKLRQAVAAALAAMLLGAGSIQCAAAEQASAAASDETVEEDVFGEEDAVELQASYVRPDYVEVERLRATKEIIVIPKSEIQEKGKRTISDVLSKVPSVSVGSTGMGEIDIRGQGSDQATRNIQVMIDGAPITTLVNHPVNTDYDVV